MRGSFGGSYGLGRNGGSFNGGGGDGMMRTIGRVMRTRINGVQDPFPSSSNSNNNSTISSSAKRSSTPPKTRGNNGNNNNNNKLIISSSQNNNSGQFPVSAAWSSCPYIVGSDDVVNGGIDEGWECLEDFYDPVFGLVPTNHEVKNAIFSVQQFLHPEEIINDVDNDMSGQITSATDVLQRASSTGSELDWIEPSMQLYNRRLANSYGWEKVYDAFHLLQTEPSVQKMVVSLSSDKAVWDAVLNNETVREIRDLYLNAAEASHLNPDNNSDALKENSNVLKWIMDHVKGKLMEVVGNITQLIGGIFNPPSPDKAEESLAFSEKLKSSFLLTILVLLIVVVTRGSKA
ncbi:uncharacterized protein LOC141617900 [Silene latifolia]|uniref:uncharacterized protein LOC141617900 n=1 Tax=Silene latifolia TaxID=37657 RepID=UPI003D7819FF